MEAVSAVYEPLAEERPYWERYFDLERVQDAHSRRNCRDQTGEEPWACGDCDCTRRLEAQMAGWGRPFLEALRGADCAEPGTGRDLLKVPPDGLEPSTR